MFDTWYARFRYGTYRRICDIFEEAPWSNHDLLVGIALTFVGIAFLINPDALQNLRAMAYFRQTGTALQWGTLFLLIGFVNIAVVLWCMAPPFWIRLLARMAGAFGFILLALSNMLFSALIPSTMIYMSVTAWSVWGILRTRSNGR